MANNTLGAYLKTLRKQQNYSQEFVASYLNVIRQTYSHYETGRITPPADMLYQLAELYQISVESLLELSIHDKGQRNVISYSNTSSPSVLCEREVAYHTLTNEELDLLTYFRTLDADNREEILEFVKLKCKRNARKKKESNL